MHDLRKMYSEIGQAMKAATDDGGVNANSFRPLLLFFLHSPLCPTVSSPPLPSPPLPPLPPPQTSRWQTLLLPSVRLSWRPPPSSALQKHPTRSEPLNSLPSLYSVLSKTQRNCCYTISILNASLTISLQLPCLFPVLPSPTPHNTTPHHTTHTTPHRITPYHTTPHNTTGIS